MISDTIDFCCYKMWWKKSANEEWRLNKKMKKIILVSLLIVTLFVPCHARVNVSISGGYATFAMTDLNDKVEASGSNLRVGTDFILNASLPISEKILLGLGIGSLYGATVISETAYSNTETRVLAIPIIINASKVLKEIKPEKLNLTGNIGIGYASVILGSGYTITGLGDAISYYTGSAGIFQGSIGINYKVFRGLELITDLGVRYMISTEFENVDYINGDDFCLDFSGIFIRAGLRF